MQAQSVSPYSTDTEDEGIALSNSPSRPRNTLLCAISENEDGPGCDDESEMDEADLAEIQQIGGGMFKEMVVKSGYLLKKGERRKVNYTYTINWSLDLTYYMLQNWKKRFFVLRPDRLCYYKDDRVYLRIHSRSIVALADCFVSKS